MVDRSALDLDRRRVPRTGRARRRGGLGWDVVRAGGDVDVTGPRSRPGASDEELAAYVRGCTQFGIDLLSELTGGEGNQNLLLSPLGLSTALAMTWAGARGETERRMRETLHFPYGQNRLHPTVGALQYDLNQLGTGIQHREVPEVWNVNRFRLGLANVLWGQATYL